MQWELSEMPHTTQNFRCNAFKLRRFAADLKALRDVPYSAILPRSLASAFGTSPPRVLPLPGAVLSCGVATSAAARMSQLGLLMLSRMLWRNPRKSLPPASLCLQKNSSHPFLPQPFQHSQCISLNQAFPRIDHNERTNE